MTRKPSDEILEYTKQVEQWMYIDMEDYRPKLREDAPEDIKEKYRKIQEDFKKPLLTE